MRPTGEFDILISGDDEGQDKSDLETRSEQQKTSSRPNEAELTILEPGRFLQETGFKAPKFSEIHELWWANTLPGYFERNKASHPTLSSIGLTKTDVNRWQMAWRATQLYTRPFSRSHKSWREGNEIDQRCNDWPYAFNIFRRPGLYLPPSIAVSFTAAALVYGGLHALAWSAHLESPTEQLLWRLSACLVMGVIPSLLIKSFLGMFLPISICLAFIPFLDTILRNLLLPAYVLARAYLVVECFINLSHLPAGVYDVPGWSAYFPHIS